MRSSVKKLEGTARELNIDLPKIDVEQGIVDVLDNIRKNARVPGFRQGKAPMDIIRKKHLQEAVEEVKQRLIPRAYQDALEKHNVNAVSYPEIFDVNMREDGALSFKAKVDCHPDVKVKQYKGLKVNANEVIVTDEEADSALEKLRNLSAEYIDTDRPLEKGDFAVCDVESFIDGNPISKKRDNMWIEVSKEASMLGIGEELAGLEKGKSKDIEVTLPEGYPDKKYAGKKAVFKVEVKESKEKKLPAIDDELAKKTGKDTIGELREEIKAQLTAKKQENENIRIKNQILEQLLKNNRFGVPGSLVSRQFKVLMERMENDLLQKGIDKDAVEARKEETKDKVLKEAEDKVRIYFILDEVAKKENVAVAEEELDSWLSSLAASYGKPPEEVKKYYLEHDLLEGLREQIKEDKTLELLVSEASISKK